MKNFSLFCLILFLVSSCTQNSEPQQEKTVTKVIISGLDHTNDPSNCGVDGYICVNGRTCVSSVCSPAWQSIDNTGASGVGYAQGATLSGKFVVVGGFSNTSTGDAVDTVQAYDPALDSWSTASSLNSARGLHAASYGEDGIFVYSGLSNIFNAATSTPQLEVLFDLSGNWNVVSVPGSPAVSYNTASTWTGSSFFTYGGSTSGSGGITSGGSITLGDAWTDVSCSLSGCERGGQYSMFPDGKFVHIIGGLFGSSPNWLLFDTESKHWYQETAPSSTPDFTTVMTARPRFGDDGRRLYFTGTAPSVWIYDRNSQTWVEDTSTQPTGLCPEAAASWVGSELVVFGGYCGGVVSSVGGRYQPPSP